MPFIDALMHMHPKHVAGSPRRRIAEWAREHWLIQKLHLNLHKVFRVINEYVTTNALQQKWAKHPFEAINSLALYKILPH